MWVAKLFLRSRVTILFRIQYELASERDHLKTTPVLVYDLL